MNNKPWRKQQNEITYFVNARQKTYKYTTEIYLPNNPYEKLEDGYELSDRDASNSGSSTPTSDEDKEERSRRRAHTAVKDIALSNSFELFATFTFASNRFNDESSRNKLMGWLKRQRKLDKNFQYLIVSELHKKCEECVENKAQHCLHDSRPKALHFHALISNYSGKIMRSINLKNGLPVIKRHRKVYHFPTYTLGNNEVYKIGETNEDQIATTFYLLKYIRKELPTFKSKKRYWASRGLNRPLTLENPEEWYFAFIPDHVIETEYGKFLFFDNKRIEIFLP